MVCKLTPSDRHTSLHGAPVQELMLVTDARGRILHITTKLAARLGRKPFDIMATANPNAIEQLLVEPFSQIHRALLQVGLSMQRLEVWSSPPSPLDPFPDLTPDPKI